MDPLRCDPRWYEEGGDGWGVGIERGGIEWWEGELWGKVVGDGVGMTWLG